MVTGGPAALNVAPLTCLTGGVDAVADAFDAVPRAGFLPAGARGRADFDGPIPIGAGQTNSQPRTVDAMLRLLKVGHGHTVLDVGSGSGWTTALLAHLTGPSGTVLGVELEPELAAWGAENLARTGSRWARIESALPGVLGDPEHGPYDRILVSAQARTLPEELLAQLWPGGVLVAPVNGRMLRVTAHADGPVVEEHGWYRFLPLVRDPPEQRSAGHPE
jgi:protein-L-isoaspartate(D-aspartate) O-methyltransferase